MKNYIILPCFPPIAEGLQIGGILLLAERITHFPGLCPEDVAPAGQPRTDTAQPPSVPKDQPLFVDVGAIRDLKWYCCILAQDHLSGSLGNCSGKCFF